MTDHGARQLFTETMWGISAGLAAVLLLQVAWVFGPEVWHRLTHPPCTPTITVNDTRPFHAGDCVDGAVLDARGAAIKADFYAASARPMESMIVPGPPPK